MKTQTKEKKAEAPIEQVARVRISIQYCNNRANIIEIDDGATAETVFRNNFRQYNIDVHTASLSGKGHIDWDLPLHADDEVVFRVIRK